MTSKPIQLETRIATPESIAELCKENGGGDMQEAGDELEEAAN
jgi:hypothetical protein